MSGFDVDVEALKGLPTLLYRASNATHRTRKYLEPYREIEHLQGRLDEEVHYRTFDALTDWLNKLEQKTIEPTTDAVSAAIRYYMHTDQTAAAQFDEKNFSSNDVSTTREDLDLTKVHSNPRPDIQALPSVGAFEDLADPLTELRAVDESAQEVGHMSDLSWYEAFSITGVANQIFTEATEILSAVGLLDRPYNPLDELFKPFVGDWAKVAATSDALTNVARH